MKRLSVVLATVTLCLFVFSAPVVAISPDPERNLPWENQNVYPNGDDSGWGVPNPGDPGPGVWSKLREYLSYGFYAVIVAPLMEKQDPPVMDDNGDTQETQDGQGASSP